MTGHASAPKGNAAVGFRRLCKLSAIGAVLLMSGCAKNGTSFMTPAGPIAALQQWHLILFTLVSLIVVLPVLILVPYLAWYYRSGNKKAKYMRDWDYNHTLELTMWVIPCIIVVVLSVLLVDATYTTDPYKKVAGRPADNPLEVQVVGLDWKWLFVYPQYHIASEGEMAFPKGRQVALTMTSDTVMQSFLIGALGGQIYTMPGMVTKMHLVADKTGDFEGMNTQYSGEGYHDQRFTAVSMEPADFDKWVAKVQSQGIALNDQSYRVLGAPSTPEELHAQLGTPAMPSKVVYFNSVAPDFFRKIVMRYHSGKPVGPKDQPGSYGYATADANG